MLDAATSGRSMPSEISPGSPWRELAVGLRAQATVIHALILRETRTRFGKQQLGYLWAFLEPALFITTFYFVFKFANRHLPMGMDIISFISTGLVPFQMFRSITSRTMGAANSNQALMVYPRVKYLDLIIARFLLELATFGTVFAILLAISSVFLGDGRTIDDLLTVILGFLAAAAMGGAFGVLMSGLGTLAPAVEKIQAAMMRPLFWISGVFFTIDGRSERVREALLWNPMLHIVEFIRGGFYPSYTATYANGWYVAMWFLLCAAAGLHIQRFALERES